MERDPAITGDAGTEPTPGDRALLDAEAHEDRRDPADRQPDTLDDDDDLRMDVSAHPASETTARTGLSDDEETIDGLDDLEEETRRQAEDRALGDGLDFRP